MVKAKHRTALDDKSDANNANKGTRGTNITWDRNQGNRGKQMDPNRKSGK